MNDVNPETPATLRVLPPEQQQPNQPPSSIEQDCSYEWVLQWASCQEKQTWQGTHGAFSSPPLCKTNVELIEKSKPLYTEM